MSPQRRFHGPAALLCLAALGQLGSCESTVATGDAALPAAPASSAPPVAAVPRLIRMEAPRDSARHIGDVVSARALIDWPSGWEIDRDGLLTETREDAPIELRGHRVEPAGEVCAGCRWLRLDWQLFKAVRITSDVPLPVTPLRMRRGSEIVTLVLPSSSLAVSPLVPWERRQDWTGSARPGWQALPFDVRAQVLELGAWLLAATFALAGWAWARGVWLPRRAARPFAVAWRQVRRRQIGRDRGVAAADAEDLRIWHTAFNATAGEVVFLEDLNAFFERNVHLSPLSEEVREVFSGSQRAFFLEGSTHLAKGLHRRDLVGLLRRLADLEFQPATNSPGKRAERLAGARV